MKRVKSLAAALPLVWITMVACETGGSPAQPSSASAPVAPANNLPIARPSEPLPDARSLMAGVMVEEDFSSLGIEDASCPGTQVRHINMPCQHYNFVAPKTGILRVSVTWDQRTEAAGLVVGDIEADPGWITQTDIYRSANPKVLRVRVEAGENYRITAFLVTSHLDFFGWLAGPFQLIATME